MNASEPITQFNPSGVGVAAPGVSGVISAFEASVYSGVISAFEASGYTLTVGEWYWVTYGVRHGNYQFSRTRKSQCMQVHNGLGLFNYLYDDFWGEPMNQPSWCPSTNCIRVEAEKPTSKLNKKGFLNAFLHSDLF